MPSNSNNQDNEPWTVMMRRAEGHELFILFYTKFSLSWKISLFFKSVCSLESSEPVTRTHVFE